jgi:Ni2+-binding GTPase involved in maturation of urease and hydrogenase
MHELSIAQSIIEGATEELGLHPGRSVAVVHLVRPGMQVFEVSAKTGTGMDKWLEFVQSHAAAI